MARNPNLKTTEDQTVVSGPCIVGRKTAGAGPAEELTGADAAGLLPDATSSAAGKMTAAYASKLDGISAGADATGFRGNLTTSQRNALTGLSAGHWVRNTDWPYGQNTETYTGSLWVRQGNIVLTNRTGGASEEGRCVQVSADYDFSVKYPNTDNDVDIIGVIETGGVADGGEIVINVGGLKIVQILMQANSNTTSGDFIIAKSGGLNYSQTNQRAGAHAISLETKNNVSSNFLIYAIEGMATEIY